MIEIKVLKSYHYRTAQIFIRQLHTHTFEFLVIYKGYLYTQHFNADDPQFGKSISEKNVGGAAFLISNWAEGLVDKLVKKKSLWYNLISKHFEFKKAE